MTRKASWCGLKDDPTLVQCCCNCKNLRPVFYHCHTEPKPTKKQMRDAGRAGLKCVCAVQKGWACCHPEIERVHDNWPQHSIGCECYDPKVQPKAARKRGKPAP